MLQPLQLEEVSAQYGVETAELRSFFTKAGLPVETAGAVHAVVQRLQDNRTFHRDLTSHLWVLMEGGRRLQDIGHGTLLGILAVAAAGPRLAAEAETDDAHDLLRFVMAARRSLDAVAPTDAAGRPEPVPPEMHEAPSELSSASLPLRRGIAVPKAEPAPASGKSKAWAVVALVVLLAAAGIWLVLRPSSQVRGVPAPIVSVPTTVQPPASSQAETGIQNEPESSARRSGSAHDVPPHRATHTPVTAAMPSHAGEAMPPQDSQGTDTSQTIARSDSPAPQQKTVPTPSAPRIMGKNVPVPSSTLSKRLGSPALPPYAPAEDEAVTRRHPRLLRRVPDTALLRENDDSLLAEAAPSDAPSLPSSGRSNATGMPHAAGTVHPASLGNMAANVVYTPVPPYPAEASAAGVQGEVRVQARIDPSGNVASARVISGPPLLRDAALNAVQHWRYKPWMASGRPTATSTVAVVDFELP